MSKQILIDDDELEHLLNCMAQLNFVPQYGPREGETTIRIAYLAMRDTLSKSANDPCSVPPANAHPLRKPLVGELIHDWSKIEDKTVYAVFQLVGKEGQTFIGQPVANYYGWQVKRLMERTYAVMILPEWNPDTLKRPRPTIEELDAILNSEDTRPIVVQADGSIKVE